MKKGKYKKHVTFSIDINVVKKLNEYADKYSINKSRFIENLIKEGLKDVFNSK
jgi:metal-responsive CopG/Arc/MetJ family transcriptional regulator